MPARRASSMEPGSRRILNIRSVPMLPEPRMATLTFLLVEDTIKIQSPFNPGGEKLHRTHPKTRARCTSARHCVSHPDSAGLREPAPGAHLQPVLRKSLHSMPRTGWRFQSWKKSLLAAYACDNGTAPLHRTGHGIASGGPDFQDAPWWP